MKQYRHRRSSNPSNTFPTLEPGEISVNTANRQLAAGDAASGTVGAPLPLIAVRYFDARGKYAVGDYVVSSGTMYKCTTAHGPAAFNPSNFTAVGTGGGGGGATLITSTTPPTPAVDNTLWWDSDNGLLYLRYNDGNSSQWVLASPIGGGGGSGGGGVSGDYLPLTGGVLSGNLGILGAALIVQEDGGNADQGFTVYSYTGHTGVQLYDFSDDYYSEGISHALMAGTQAAPMPVQEQAEIGYTNWGGWDGSKVVFSAAMTGAVDGPVSDGVVPVALVLKSGSGAYGTERLRLKSNGTTLITGQLDVLGQVSVSGPLIAYPPAASLPTGGPAVLCSKPRDPDNGRRYDFQDCGGLSSDYGGGFWRGMHFTAPPITDPVGGAALYPRIGIYSEYDTLTGPASRTWNLDMQGDSPTSKHTFHLRNNGADIFTANDAGVKSNAPLAAMNWFYSLANLPGIAPDFGGQTNGLGIGWNYSNGQGEVNLVSRYSGQTGFWFQNWNGSAMATWAKIDVNGLDVQNGIKLHGSTPYQPQMQIYSSTPDATAGYLLLTKSRNGGVVQVNDGFGAIVFTGYTADGVSRNSTSLTSNVLGVGADWIAGDLSINTIHTDGSYAPRINISGNAVSIGPQLLTQGSARFGGAVTIGVPIPGNDPSYKLTDSDNNTYANYFGPGFMAIDNYGANCPTISFDYARGTMNASTAVQSGNNLGQIAWSAQTGPNPATDWVTPASLAVTVDAPVTGGVAPAAFSFISNGVSNLFIGSDGRLTVRGDPVNPLHLATKQYVDAGVRAINNVTATTYTLVLTDTGKLLSVFNGPSNAVSITVPLNATVAFAIGAQIDIASSIANVVTIVPASGVIMNSEDSKRKLPKQGSCATLVKVSTDVWVLSGSLMA